MQSKTVVSTFAALGAVALLVLSGEARAQFSATVTGTSDYDFRGVSLSAKNPALQASLDYELPNGFAIGIWGSNIDSDYYDFDAEEQVNIDDDIEVDYYLTYSAEINEDASFNAGFTFYDYPGGDDTAGYPEYYVGVTLQAIDIKQWYSHKFLGLDESAQYTEVNYSHELPNNFSLAFHGGYSWGDYWKSAGGAIFDYSVGVGYTLNRFDLGLKLTGTDASGDQKVTDDTFNNEARIVFTVSTTFPWSDE